jgi:CheY-like chemotaxis protein
MVMLDREIDSAQALVIDGNPTSRSIIAAQLRELGVSQVSQVSRLADGRKRLEARRYDIVVCEQQFPGDDQTGQELLDELRRENLLPYGTVFIMITGEARYEHVAEAAESALDSYLLKPYAASTLADRWVASSPPSSPTTSRRPPSCAWTASPSAASSGSTPPASAPN